MKLASLFIVAATLAGFGVPAQAGWGTICHIGLYTTCEVSPGACYARGGRRDLSEGPCLLSPYRSSITKKHPRAAGKSKAPN